MALSRDAQQLINKRSGAFLKNSFEARVLPSFEKIKSEMINEFLDHKVTQEIKAGPTAENISGTLGGYGNLFSYIGFNEGDEPIEPILDLLKRTTIQFSRIIDGGAVWNIFMPDKQDIWEVTPLPWAEGRSWAKGIETGISGLGEYLYTEDGDLPTSRSGTGLELKSKIRRKSRFKNVKYITDLLKKYEKRFSELNEASIST
jgi:hypothetical protein